jgi:hypothetical protein
VAGINILFDSEVVRKGEKSVRKVPPNPAVHYRQGGLDAGARGRRHQLEGRHARHIEAAAAARDVGGEGAPELVLVVHWVCAGKCGGNAEANTFLLFLSFQAFTLI